MERVEKFLQSYEAGRVLDVATGQGNFIPFILECKSYDEIVAVDTIAEFAQAIDKQFGDKKVTFKVADAYKLPFNDNSFDTVTMSNSIHHFEKPAKILAEIGRVLKPDGRVIIHEMYSDNLSPAQQSHKLIHHISAERDMILGNFHAETYTKQDLGSIAESSFAKVELIDYSYPAGDVMEKEKVDHILKICDVMIDQSGKRDELKVLIPKFEEAKKYIQKNGYASASSLFFVGAKL